MNPSKTLSHRILNWMGTFLVAIVWTSAVIFGIYILAFYVLDFFQGDYERWNLVLPGLYDASNKTATLGMGLHFVAGGIILVLGCIQLMQGIRRRYPAFHRWIGRVYVLASIFAAIGGLTFIFLKGTVGGLVMDIGFGLYGILMFLAAIQTIRYARLQQFEQHRAWALRLFALAIGSWLYRMDYGFWIILTGSYGMGEAFSGPFDKVMSFFFYLPNLLVAEVFIARYQVLKNTAARLVAALALFLAGFVLLVGTYYFTKMLWGKVIMEVLGFS